MDTDANCGNLRHAQEVGDADVVAKGVEAPAGGAECADCPVVPLKALPDNCPFPETDLIGNLLDPINGPAAGLPYQVHYLGPPRPGCEDQRLATVRALGRVDDPSEDPEIRNILELCSSIFKAPASLCALFDEQRVFITEQDGNVIPRGNFPWRWTLCGWSLAFKNPQVLVIPDTHLDARFANNIKITEPPHVRFYCGAPLVASNGHRLGTLCFADVQPRVFDAASCILMNNLSELVVRQLEKNIALKARVQENEELSVAYGGLRRTLDAFDACVALVDMSAKPGGVVVYANAALLKWMGRERSEVSGQLLSSLFEAKGGAPIIDAAAQQAIAANKPHTVTSAVSHGSGSDASDVQLQLRPAASGMLDDNVMPVGIPAFLPQGSTLVDGKQFYFVLVEGKQASRRNKRSAGTRSSCSSVAHASSRCEGLDLQHLLGKGSFGSVYYGTWFDTPVAIKIMEMEDSDNRAALEAMLGQQLKHPNVLTTYHHFTKPLGGSAEPSVGYSAQGPLSRMSPSVSVDDSTGKRDVSGSGNASGGPPAVPDAVDCGWPVIDYEAESKRKGVAGPGIIDTSSDGWLSGANTVTTKRWVQAWIVMEYADRGSLQEALDRGWLCADRANVLAGPSLPAVLATATEVAAAMKYLHDYNVVHGDLSGWNIMLCSGTQGAALGGRGFSAKVADFGLARMLNMAKEVLTKTYGTLTHQPPETLTSGVVSKATDVYSFGVLLWQMYTCSRPWSGLSHAQIINKVGHDKAKLKWPVSAHTPYRELAQACMAEDPADRPPFAAILQRIAAMQGDVEASGSVPCPLQMEWE